jgi:hypothetical protein
MAANPNTGKTHPRHFRVLVDGYDLSGDMRSLNSFGVTFEQADATGWSNGTRQWLNGQGTVLLDGLTALFNNETTGTGPTLAGAHTVLNGETTLNASVFMGIRAAPAIGNPAFGSPFEQGSYVVSGGVGTDPVMVNASYYGSATQSLDAAVFGVALHAGAELTGTTNNASVDGLASSANGWIAYLHVTQTAGAQASNNWEFKIEHGTNDSTWATLTTFTANGNAITSERKEGSGTVNRYVRLVSTRTAGTARPWVVFIRK